MEYEKMLEEALWSAKALFDRGLVTGSAANMSFRVKEQLYITRSGGIFGRLTEADFSVVSLEGEVLEGPKPSKELPLHLAFYRRKPEVCAVTHTHSFYTALWSCLPDRNRRDGLPRYTPYLAMQLGEVPLVDYHPPGSEALFTDLEERLGSGGNGYLLGNHGPVVGGTSPLDVFCKLEELEAAAKTAWYLEGTGALTIK